MKKSFILFLCFFFSTCMFPNSDETESGQFAIYLLQDSTLSASNAFNQSLDSLALKKPAFIRDKDLKYYYWDEHSFELKSTSVRVDFENFILGNGSTRGVPFVVGVGDEHIYLGTFWWAYSSSLPPSCAVIDVIGPLPYKIKLANGAIDNRKNPQIYNALKRSGVLIE